LATRSAWNDWGFSVSDDRERLKGLFTLGDCFPYADPFGAHRKTERQILDVAARDNGP
jgi:hypothetical protein